MMVATSAAALSAPDRRSKKLRDHLFLGTDLTFGGAIITLAAAPVMWLIIALVWTALPA